MGFPLHYPAADVALNSPLVIHTSEFSNRFFATLHSIDNGLSSGLTYRNRSLVISQFLLSMSTLFQKLSALVQSPEISLSFLYFSLTFSHSLCVVVCFVFDFDLDFIAVI